jgi:hypothetical protein
MAKDIPITTLPEGLDNLYEHRWSTSRREEEFQNKVPLAYRIGDGPCDPRGLTKFRKAEPDCEVFESMKVSNNDPAFCSTTAAEFGAAAV